MEYWDIYDIERKKTDRTMIRGEDFKEGDYHMVVHICIFNSDGQMLIQQRQPFKEGWSNLWDITVGGSSVKGDNSQRAIERELEEELGIKMSFENVRPHLTINSNHRFDDVYLIEKDIDINDLSLQYEEVQAVKWASKEEIISMIEDGVFIPYYPSLIQVFFDMRKGYGSHQKNKL